MALSKIDVANMLSATLPVANGGTGLTSGTSGQFLKFTGSTTLASAADNGKILQVESGAGIGGNTSTTNTSFVETTTVDSITPTAASSKILLMFSFNCGAATDNNSVKIRYYRQVNGGGYSAIGDNAYFQGTYTNAGGQVTGHMTATYLDSPSYSLTNQIDYKIYIASSAGGTVNIYNEGGNKNNLTMIEVAG